MLDGHRKQISESESGMAGSVISRHNKTKQSIGDSMKLASGAMHALSFAQGVLTEGVRPVLAPINHLADAVGGKYGPNMNGMKAHSLGRAVGGIGVLGGAYALGKKHHEKKAMMPSQPAVQPELQQQFRGRTAKAKDVTTVSGAMTDVNNMLSQGANEQGGAQQ